MGSIRPLIALIDTLWIGWYVNFFKLSEREWDYLEEWKQVARSQGYDNSPMQDFYGIPFRMRAANHHYAYVLYNNDFTLKLARKLSGWYPEIMVEFRSQLLLGGEDSAYRAVLNWLEEIADIKRDDAGHIKEKVARADLALDMDCGITDFEISPENIVKRSRKRVGHYEPMECEEHYEGLRLTGYTFGSGDLLMRIYDKTYQVKKKRLQYIQEEWKQKGWKEGSNITRIECQMRRDKIKEWGINTFEDFKRGAADIWKYLTEEWFSLRIKKHSDDSRSRWPVSEIWKIVQSSFECFGNLSGIVRKKIKDVKIQNIIPQLAGLCTSLMALTGRDDLNPGELFERINIYYRERKKRIKTVIQEKRKSYRSLDDLPSPVVGLALQLFGGAVIE